jgi:hypothetical protein
VFGKLGGRDEYRSTGSFLNRRFQLLHSPINLLVIDNRGRRDQQVIA